MACHVIEHETSNFADPLPSPLGVTTLPLTYPPKKTGVQEVMPGGADGEALHGGGEDQPHGLHLGVAVHRLRYLRQEGVAGGRAWRPPPTEKSKPGRASDIRIRSKKDYCRSTLFAGAVRTSEGNHGNVARLASLETIHARSGKTTDKNRAVALFVVCSAAYCLPLLFLYRLVANEK